MTVRIRLTRIGRKNIPLFRIVVLDKKTKRDGKYLERLGDYNPKEEEAKKVKINKDRLLYWVKNGAQPTEALKIIFKKAKIALK
ncbi:MAG: 30S ribosomal protein S16 [Planctomycetes bacterium]|nr:30S ribosomal protein S16 [Planctomycetota bacterium]